VVVLSEKLKEIIEKDMPEIINYIMASDEWSTEYKARLISDANTALQMLKILQVRMKEE